MKIQSPDWAGWKKWCTLSIRALRLVRNRPSSDIPVSWGFFGVCTHCHSGSHWTKQQKQNTKEKQPCKGKKRVSAGRANS